MVLSMAWDSELKVGVCVYATPYVECATRILPCVRTVITSLDSGSCKMVVNNVFPHICFIFNDALPQ